MNICLHLERCVYKSNENQKYLLNVNNMLGYIDWKGYIRKISNMQEGYRQY